MNDLSAKKVQELLSLAGVTIGGDQPQDIQIFDSSVYDRWLRDGSLGIGESYMTVPGQQTPSIKLLST